MRLFGKASKAPPVNETVQKLKDSLSNMEKRETFLQSLCTIESEKARKAIKLNNKRDTLRCIKRKKNYEKQIERIQNTIEIIENQITCIETASFNTEIVETLKTVSKTMKEQQESISINEVDDVMDDIRGQIDKQEEISDALSQPIMGELYDEDLEKELEMLEEELKEEVDKKFEKLKIQSEEIEENEERDSFKRLQESMLV